MYGDAFENMITDSSCSLLPDIHRITLETRKYEKESQYARDEGGLGSIHDGECYMSVGRGWNR